MDHELRWAIRGAHPRQDLPKKELGGSQTEKRYLTRGIHIETVFETWEKCRNTHETVEKDGLRLLPVR
jgi:hypothetical protein